MSTSLFSEFADSEFNDAARLTVGSMDGEVAESEEESDVSFSSDFFGLDEYFEGFLAGSFSSDIFLGFAQRFNLSVSWDQNLLKPVFLCGI